MKQQFLDIFQTRVTRPGADRLLDWLQTTDFFTAPASSRFHLAKEGGLCEHSLHVYDRLRALYRAELTEGRELTPGAGGERGHLRPAARPVQGGSLCP